MTTDSRTALELRLALTDIFTADDPPPGASRASGLLFVLRREPECREHQQRARDLLAVLDLRARLIAHRERAERTDALALAVIAHGLVGHADAELLGSTGEPGWRAAALDLLEPDSDGDADPIDPVTARRLFGLALGLCGDDACDDAAGE